MFGKNKNNNSESPIPQVMRNVSRNLGTFCAYQIFPRFCSEQVIIKDTSPLEYSSKSYIPLFRASSLLLISFTSQR